MCVAHGDDGVYNSTREQRGAINAHLKAKWKIGDNFIGSGVRDPKALKVLNRELRWTEAGIEHEPDRRHVEILTNKHDDTGKTLATPAAHDKTAGDPDNEITQSEAKEYRGDAARLNYLAADRGDLQFAVKVLRADDVANPTAMNQVRLKRVVMYLKNPNNRFEFQLYPFGLNVTDVSITPTGIGLGVREPARVQAGGPSMSAAASSSHGAARNVTWPLPPARARSTPWPRA